MSIDIPPLTISTEDQSSFEWIMRIYKCKNPSELAIKGIEVLYEIERLRAVNQAKASGVENVVTIKAPKITVIRPTDALRANESRTVSIKPEDLAQAS